MPLFCSYWHWRCFPGNTWHWTMPTEQTEKVHCVQMCSMRLSANRIPLVWPEKFTIVFWFDSRISLSQHVARGHKHTVHNPVIKWNITLKYYILLANSISVFCILLFGSSANADRFVTGSSVWMQSFIFELLRLRIILLIIAECLCQNDRYTFLLACEFIVSSNCSLLQIVKVHRMPINCCCNTSQN